MVLEYRVGWTNPAGGPGLSVFHGRSVAVDPPQLAADDLASRVREFFDDIKLYVPNNITWSFPDEVTDLNTTTGVLEGTFAVDGGADIAAIGESKWAAPAGFRFVWGTEAIVAGRRLRGSTFIVPMDSFYLDDLGTIDGSAITALTTAGETFFDVGVFTSVQPSVWSRTHGIQADITSVRVPDKVAILTSRRD